MEQIGILAPPPDFYVGFSQDCCLVQIANDGFICFCRSDTVRYALDILSILTVVPKTQLLMSEAVAVFDEGGSSVSTIGRPCLIDGNEFMENMCYSV